MVVQHFSVEPNVVGTDSNRVQTIEDIFAAADDEPRARLAEWDATSVGAGNGFYELAGFRGDMDDQW